MTVDSLGNEANGDSGLPTLSANGRLVAFVSNADNLVPDDSNGVSDIFLISLDDLCDYGCNTLVGLHHPVSGFFTLERADGSHKAGASFRYGPRNTDWIAIVGDWDGDGVDTMGLYNPIQGQFYLRNAHAGGVADVVFRYGPTNAGWEPIAGDWDGDGQDTVGLYRPQTGYFYLRNTHTPGVAHVKFPYGATNGEWWPLVGKWQ